MKKVIVASQNPVKLNAAKIAFTHMFPDEEFDVQGISVESGVSDQPLSDAETYQGAETRAYNAQKAMPEADFWVGLEGGVELKNSEMEAFAWMVVLNANGMKGKGRTGTFFLPQKVVELVQQGKELGEADDIVFGQTNSKQANGSIGLLTHDRITRRDYYETALMLALIPFINPELYN